MILLFYNLIIRFSIDLYFLITIIIMNELAIKGFIHTIIIAFKFDFDL